MLNLVGVARFELATSRPPDARATKLRYTPKHKFNGDKTYVRYTNDLSTECNKMQLKNHFIAAKWLIIVLYLLVH